MRVETFSEVYGVSKESIYTAKSTGTLPEGAFRIENKTVYMNTKFFDRRVKFRKRVWLESHDNYFFITKTINEYTLANMLSRWVGGSQQSWAVFMSQDLFSPNTKSILRYQVSGRLWLFFRLTSWLIQIMFKRLGVPKEKRDKEVMICR